jgi:prolyl oligopeptidase
MVDAEAVSDRIAVTYLENAISSLRLYSLRGTPSGTVPMPGIGTVSEVTGHETDEEFFYAFQSYLSPPTIYRYDLKKNRQTVFKQPTVPADLSPYETIQVFVPSKDGTAVPMFITARKGTKLDGTHPTLLYGYGGFNVSLTPEFSAEKLVWLEMGGIYAVANLRGGGELGETWHQAGTLGKKQNVFDDFIAAAEYLVARGYTSAQKLAIQGGSNGGLLVGAVTAQRPDLFAVALPAVGVMDMLRFHKFTIGWAWVSDYGSSDNPEQFKFLYAYSPLHNLKNGTSYPATLITTGDHDDRVVPGHSFKYAAALQAAQGGPAPVLIRIETRAGHGAGKPTSKRIEEAADRLAFTAHRLGMTAVPIP